MTARPRRPLLAPREALLLNTYHPEGDAMNGGLYVRRDPVTIGAAISVIFTMLSVAAHWPLGVQVAGTLVIGAAVAVVQAINVFGTDKFTAVGVNFVGAALGLLLALNLHVPDDLQKAVMAAVPILLALFARGQVTNRFTAMGTERTTSDPVGQLTQEVRNLGVAEVSPVTASHGGGAGLQAEPDPHGYPNRPGDYPPVA